MNNQEIITLYELLHKYKDEVKKQIANNEREYKADSTSKEKFATLLFVQQELENVEELIESLSFSLPTIP